MHRVFGASGFPQPSKLRPFLPPHRTHPPSPDSHAHRGDSTYLETLAVSDMRRAATQLRSPWAYLLSALAAQHEWPPKAR